MKWLIAHAQELFAIIGVLYVAALMIVKLTPTPKDDLAVEKVGKWLNGLAKLFGLDIKQGINTPTNKTGNLLILFLGISVFSGCAMFSDHRTSLVGAQKTFASTVKALTVLNENGCIGQEEAVVIDTAIQYANAGLKAWEAAILQNDKGVGAISDDALSRINRLVDLYYDASQKDHWVEPVPKKQQTGD